MVFPWFIHGAAPLCRPLTTFPTFPRSRTAAMAWQHGCWRFPKMGIPLNHQSFLMGVPLINHPAIGVPSQLWKPPYVYDVYGLGLTVSWWVHHIPWIFVPKWMSQPRYHETIAPPPGRCWRPAGPFAELAACLQASPRCHGRVWKAWSYPNSWLV